MQGKLDWTLLRGLQVLSASMGNDDYAASDHRWLLVKVVIANDNSTHKHSIHSADDDCQQAETLCK